MDKKTQRQIEAVVKSKEKDDSIHIPMTPVRHVETFLTSLGFDKLELDGEEINGWQVDFWYKFNHKTFGKFMLSGSLHYGNFQFGKYVDEDDDDEDYTDFDGD